MTETERRQIIALVKSEVIPAIGCTEPIAVALCVAKAAEVLNKRPEKITVLLSANILKNAMGVGIPGTGMIGLPIAVALGALIGKSVYQLEVLKDSTPDAVEAGKRFIEEKGDDSHVKATTSANAALGWATVPSVLQPRCQAHHRLPVCADSAHPRLHHHAAAGHLGQARQPRPCAV